MADLAQQIELDPANLIPIFHLFIFWVELLVAEDHLL